MIKFISFGSGSSGNCYYLETGGRGLIVDAGVGWRLLRKLTNEYGISLERAVAVVLTHDHTDHIKAVGAVANAYNLPVYAGVGVHKRIESNYMVRTKVPQRLKRMVEGNTVMEIGPYRVEAVSVPHDSRQNYGYSITAGGTKLCILTDVGHFTPEMERLVADCDFLVVEANYDKGMLDSGPYPERLKKRIASGNGHSENSQTAAFVAQTATERLKRVWLCHLSQENNTPLLAVEAVRNAVCSLPEPMNGIRVEALPRTEVAGPFNLD